jgi:hypothetical protein
MERKTLYADQDLVELKAQLKRRWLSLLLPELALLALLVYTLVVRNKTLTVLCSIAMGCLAVSMLTLWIMPVRRYLLFLQEALQGRHRELEGKFKGFDHLPVQREGLCFMPFIVNVGNPEEEKDDRLLYWDWNLPLPPWQPAQSLWISSFDKVVLAWGVPGAAESVETGAQDNP